MDKRRTTKRESWAARVKRQAIKLAQDESRKRANRRRRRAIPRVLRFRYRERLTTPTVERWVRRHRNEPIPPRYRVDEFQPLEQPIGDQLAELYDLVDRIDFENLDLDDPDFDVRGQEGEQGRRNRRARTINWRFERELNRPLVDRMLNKIREAVQTRHKIILTLAYNLRNIENNETMVFYSRHPAPWFDRLSDTRAWLLEQDELRLQGERVDRPNTKWVFEGTAFVDLKVILDRQPLLIGIGALPAWLRNKREVISLDDYNDDLCVFRCLVVHQGARRDRNTRMARELARDFFAACPKARTNGNLVALNKMHLVEKHFKQGIAAYTVEDNGDFVLSYMPSRYDKVEIPTMTIGIYGNHAFLITNINKVANNYACGQCNARFTQATHLTRHSKTCARGQTVIDCPGEKIVAPESAFERAFYPKSTFGIKATKWLVYESNRRRIHIHHQMCGHGGERSIDKYKVDGYHPESKTVFQFHGCYFHGCLKCYPKPEQRNEVIWTGGGKTITRQQAYQRTLNTSHCIRNILRYNLVEKWECEQPQPWAKAWFPRKKTETYPHAIVFDFEAYQDSTKASQPTRDLSYEGEHVPISVSIADTLNREPEYLCSKNPKELIQQFYESLERRRAAIVEDMAEYLPPDTEGLTQKQQDLINQWVTQVPVVGFNSGKYDLHLIRKHFVSHLGKEDSVFAAEKNGRIMFLSTPSFKFLDVCNYLSPGITYDKWVKTYGATQTKSWLPYEWFDSADKLDHKGLPPYWCWYSKLRNRFVLTPAEYKECKRVWKEKGMETFGDWLKYYNNLDVTPFLEALETMKDFYTKLGIDIFKDAVSLPGVSMQYILRGTLSGRDPPQLYAPGPEAYEMLKEAVVGGPSLVFTRKHVAGVSRIRPHKYGDEARVVRIVLGFDANSLYPSTMMKEMPTGKEIVVHYPDPVAAAPELIKRLRSKWWFGFAEVDIEVPRALWAKFEEFPPIFVNRSVGEAGVPQHMKDYLANSGRGFFPDQKKLLGVLSAQKVLLYAPMLEWYLDHGLKITAVYRTIDYVPKKLFDWFVRMVANARREGDNDKEKALLAEVYKLLGNSAYGKFIEAVERQMRVVYTSDETVVDKHLRSAWFEDLEEIGDAYKIECRKNKITINRPFQIGITVYQLAKLRMLEFYYDFLDRYLDRRDFELIQMDTDSMYLAHSTETLEEAVRPELKEEFEREKKKWLSWDKWSNREPGLFKLECEGTRAIALSSKCYFVEDEHSGKAKMSSKGMSKAQNELLWQRYDMALDGYKDRATNRGFRMHKGSMYTYEQSKLGLSAYYDKRRVLPDGIHTEPIEFHLNPQE